MKTSSICIAIFAFFAGILTGRGQEVPVELTAARTDYEARLATPRLKLDTSIKARVAKYAADLKAIEDRATAAGQLDAVVAVKAEREAYEKGERTNGFATGNTKVPAAARQVRAALEGDLMRVRASAAPEGRALAMSYLQQLNDLERKLTTQKNVDGALAVRREREETQLSGLDPLNPPATGLIGDWAPRESPGTTLRGKTITFKRDGTWTSFEGVTGKWSWVDKGKRTLKFHWDDRNWEDTYTLSPDGKKLQGQDGQKHQFVMDRMP